MRYKDAETGAKLEFCKNRWIFPCSNIDLIVSSSALFIYLLNLTPVQTEHTRQSHSRTVQPEQGPKGQ